MDKNGSIVVKYKCDAWGNHTVLDGNGNINTSDTFIGNINPFRYKCYYYDKETKMYYCESRYYVPEWCRWLNGDSIGFLNTSDIHGMNLFAYCSNNPVMGIDPTGQWDWSTFWKTMADVAVTIGSIAAGVVTSNISIAAGIIVGGGINNAVNAIYYNSIKPNENAKFEFDDKGNVSIGDYRNGYVNSWDRLQNIKDMYNQSGFGSTSFGFNQWRSYSEYNLHMYGWFASGWACDKEIPLFSLVAGSCQVAEIAPNHGDSRPYVDVLSIILGILGL